MKIKLRLSISVWLTMLFITSAVAADTNQFDRAINAITNLLPAGWTIAEQKTNEIPWGHHWNENYTGPKGILVIVKGIRPVNAEFSDTNGTWRAIHVATESLQIWLMPSNYSDSFWAWFSIDRPIQPTVIVAHGPIKVYATPAHLLLSEKQFWEILYKFNGVRWPDSPGNSPVFHSPADTPKPLTWKDWQLKLRKAIENEFTK
jgi:hypothetical protein